MTIELIEIGPLEARIPEGWLNKKSFHKIDTDKAKSSFGLVSTNLCLIKNISIKASCSDFVILSDDGLSYSKYLVDQVLYLHKNNPAYSVIVFYASKYRNKVNKSYYNIPRVININDVQFLHDFEISLAVNTVTSCELQYNENFGRGGRFPYYENKVFVADAIKKGLKVLAMPGSIEVYTNDLYWDKELSAIKQKSMGAALCNIYGLQYIHQYVAISMSRLFEEEKSSNKINDWALAKIQLLLKGAYDYLNFTTDGKDIAY
jgi:hypothetical protein